jgi:hypothetical protein
VPGGLPDVARERLHRLGLELKHRLPRRMQELRLPGLQREPQQQPWEPSVRPAWVLKA